MSKVMAKTLQDALDGLETGLAEVLLAIGQGVADIAASLRACAPGEAGTHNALGDAQLLADVAADDAMFAALRACPAAATASSEERPQDHDVRGRGGATASAPATAPAPAPTAGAHQRALYSVAFDPLDGSSVMPANWAVGAIFGVWPGAAGFVGRCGREQVAAGYAVFGPRTLLVLARPTAAGGGEGARAQEMVVQEYELVGQQGGGDSGGGGGGWALLRDGVRLAERGKLFAPANLRAASENGAYRALVDAWLAEQYTLRYSGAMVPDLHMLLTRGHGVFANPVSPGAPPKLRSLYECLPLALVVEAAGGAAIDGEGEVLDGVLSAHDQRRSVCLGSRGEVERCRAAMGLPPPQ